MGSGKRSASWHESRHPDIPVLGVPFPMDIPNNTGHRHCCVISKALLTPGNVEHEHQHLSLIKKKNRKYNRRKHLSKKEPRVFVDGAALPTWLTVARRQTMSIKYPLLEVASRVGVICDEKGRWRNGSRWVRAVSSRKQIRKGDSVQWAGAVAT